MKGVALTQILSRKFTSAYVQFRNPQLQIKAKILQSLSVVTGQPLSTGSNKTINLRANNKASGKEG